MVSHHDLTARAYPACPGCAATTWACCIGMLPTTWAVRVKEALDAALTSCLHYTSCWQSREASTGRTNMSAATSFQRVGTVQTNPRWHGMIRAGQAPRGCRGWVSASTRLGAFLPLPVVCDPLHAHAEQGGQRRSRTVAAHNLYCVTCEALLARAGQASSSAS